MTLSLKQLRYFVAIVDAGALSRAAETLSIAQSALSHHVAEMEATLGVTLLDRGARGVSVTAAGRRLHEHAGAILAALEKAALDVRTVAGMTAGPIAIGLCHTAVEVVSLPIMQETRRLWPDIQLTVVEGLSGALIDRVIVRACEYYASLGIRAVAIVAPFYYKLSPASVYAYFAEIGRNTPIDVTLYNIPMFASPIDVPTIQRLSEEYEGIVAIKDSSGDIPHMIRMIQAVRPNRPEFAFLTGWYAALMPMLLAGCDGGTNASSGVVPELTRKLYDLTTAYKIDEARKVQYDLIRLFDTMIYSAEFPLKASEPAIGEFRADNSSADQIYTKSLKANRSG